MANIFLNIPALAANGAGTPVDISSFGPLKTIVCSGSWTLEPTINIEINNAADSNDGSWQSIATFQGSGGTTLSIAARWVRARLIGFRGGQAPVIYIGATDDGTDFATLVAPAGNGSGSAVDVSALPQFKTVQVSGAFRGSIIIEISEDGGATWGTQMSFSQAGVQTAEFVADFMRVSRNGVPTTAPGLPEVNLGACAVGGGGGGAAYTPEFVDLQQAGVVANDASAGLSNVTIINALIEQYRILGRPVAFGAQQGDIYIDKAGTNWSILFGDGCSNMTLFGQGKYATRFVQSGVGTANDWFGIAIRAVNASVTNINLRDFGIMQGTIDIPSSGQHDHLICIQNLGGDPSVVVSGITGSSLHFGKALGDCLAFIGDTQIVRDSLFTDVTMNGLGFVQAAWQPNHAYALNSQVRNGNNAYICITAGVSAASGGPTGTSSNITDGTVHWSGAPADITYRYAARSGVSFQRNYFNTQISDFIIEGVQNSQIDMESTGSGRLDFARITDGFCDNTLGNTANGINLGGSTSHTDPTRVSEISNVTLYNGCIQVDETFAGLMSGVRVIADQAFANDPSTPLLYLQSNSDNDGLVIRDLGLYRLSGCGNGDVLAIQGSGEVRFDGLSIIQETNGYPMTIESQSTAEGPLGLTSFRISGASSIRFAGSSFNYDAINLLAVNASMDNVRIDNLHVSVEGGSLQSAIRFNCRAPRTMRNMGVINCTADVGSVLAGVVYSQETGSVIDPNPMFQGNDFGNATPFLTVDESDNPIFTIFPMISGDRNGVYTITGTVDPGTGTGAKAPPGTHYIWIKDDGTAADYFKEQYSSRSGWTKVTVGPQSVAPYELPGDQTEWDAFIVANLLDVNPDGPIASPNGSWKADALSGDQNPSIGTLPLIASGAVTYGVVQSGYTDPAEGIPDNGANTGFQTTDATLPNPATTSYLQIVIGQLLAVPAASRSIFSISDDNRIRIINFAGEARARVLLGGNDVTPAVALSTTAVKVWVTQVNETANTCFFGTEDFKSTPAYTSPSSAAKRFSVGGFDNNSAPFNVLRTYKWTGSIAELTQNQLRALIEAFGAAVSW